MRHKLQLIDKFRRPSWFKGGDHYYFVLRVMDSDRLDAKIYERKVSRQCYYRFNLNDYLFSRKPGGKSLMTEAKEDF